MNTNEHQDEEAASFMPGADFQSWTAATVATEADDDEAVTMISTDLARATQDLHDHPSRWSLSTASDHFNLPLIQLSTPSQRSQELMTQCRNASGAPLSVSSTQRSEHEIQLTQPSVRSSAGSVSLQRSQEPSERRRARDSYASPAVSSTRTNSEVQLDAELSISDAAESLEALSVPAGSSKAPRQRRRHGQETKVVKLDFTDEKVKLKDVACEDKEVNRNGVLVRIPTVVSIKGILVEDIKYIDVRTLCIHWGIRGY